MSNLVACGWSHFPSIHKGPDLKAAAGPEDNVKRRCRVLKPFPVGGQFPAVSPLERISISSHPRCVSVRSRESTSPSATIFVICLSAETGR